jgi:hypothetical protein
MFAVFVLVIGLNVVVAVQFDDIDDLMQIILRPINLMVVVLMIETR